LSILVIAMILGAKFLSNLYFAGNIIIVSGVSIITAFTIGKIYFKSKLLWTAMSAMFAFLAGAITELIAVIIITRFQAIYMEEIMQFGIHRLFVRAMSCLLLLIVVIIMGRFKKSSMS
ncbi:MAG: hypothetical protein FWF81_01850, partial [Defluviitaleaceae bacterium]|nr:hypothetical protein [Defluviitaleaceae bacterium]